MDIVFVDELTWTTNNLCGASRTTSCKDLSVGIRRTKEKGAVYAIGYQLLRNTVMLDKSINIVSDDMQQGMISSVRSIDFAFQLRCKKGIVVKVRGLHFYNTVIIHLESCKDKPDIEIDGITLRNVTRSGLTVQIGILKQSDELKTGSFVVRSSLFEDCNGIHIFGMKRVRIYNCTFRNQPTPRNLILVCGISDQLIAVTHAFIKFDEIW